ncbi:unnamed protein product, partial [Brenthis ino]
MSESEGEEKCGVSTPKKKRVERGDLKVKEKHRQQKYRVEWQCDPKFCKWLTRDPQDNFKSRCKENNTVKLARVAEVKLAAYFAEHNIAFNSADHLGKVLKECFTDLKILKETTITRKKTAKIIYNGIGPEHKEELANKLKTSNSAL